MVSAFLFKNCYTKNIVININKMKQYNLIELQKELSIIPSLTNKERNIIFNDLKKYSGGGGISYTELYNVIMKLRKEYKISEIDEKYLKRLLIHLK